MSSTSLDQDALFVLLVGHVVDFPAAWRVALVAGVMQSLSQDDLDAVLFIGRELLKENCRAARGVALENVSWKHSPPEGSW